MKVERERQNSRNKRQSKVTITCTLFADEIVGIVLGAKWAAVAPIFRLLAPVALVFAVTNPLS